MRTTRKLTFEGGDAEMGVFYLSKINLIRERIQNNATTTGSENSGFHQRALDVHVGRHRVWPSHSVEDYGIQTSVFYRLKLQNTLEKINKNCEIHEKRLCSTCREEYDEMAMRDYLFNRRASLIEELTANRLESVSFLEDPLVIAGEISQFATSLQHHPEDVMQALLKPLRGNR